MPRAELSPLTHTLKAALPVASRRTCTDTEPGHGEHTLLPAPLWVASIFREGQSAGEGLGRRTSPALALSPDGKRTHRDIRGCSSSSRTDGRRFVFWSTDSFEPGNEEIIPRRRHRVGKRSREEFLISLSSDVISCAPDFLFFAGIRGTCREWGNELPAIQGEVYNRLMQLRK